MEQTTSLTRETNIFPSIAVHAGHSQLLLPSVTESKFREKLNGLTSTYLHKFSFHVNCQTKDAMEEMPELLTSGLLQTTSLMRHVHLTKLMVTTTELDVQP